MWNFSSLPPGGMAEGSCSSSKGRNSLHRVKSFELERLEVDNEFSGVRLLAEGWYARVYSAYHHTSDTRLALKCVHKETTKKKDFFREIHYNYYLSPHPNIINSFEVAFDTATSYVFALELAPEGDLSAFVKRGGLGEVKAKRVAEQIAFALEFIHSKDLVHRDIRLENLFVFDKDMCRIKLGDFGLTQRAGTLVKKVNVRVPWTPPEICRAVYNEGYEVETSQDVWQLGILIFVLLTGSFPWYSADITDRHYTAWVAWLKRKTTKVPQRFKCFSPRLLRLLRRLLEPKPEKRAEVQEVYKYISDSWLIKGSDPQDIALDDCSEIFVAASKLTCEFTDRNCLDDMLKIYGVKTTVDHDETEQRVCEWLLATHNSSKATTHRGM